MVPKIALKLLAISHQLFSEIYFTHFRGKKVRYYAYVCPLYSHDSGYKTYYARYGASGEEKAARKRGARR
jgi:hypothetical protein